MNIREAVQAAKTLNKETVATSDYNILKVVDDKVVLFTKKGEFVFDFNKRKIVNQNNEELTLADLPKSKDILLKNKLLGYREETRLTPAYQRKFYDILYFLCVKRPKAFDAYFNKRGVETVLKNEVQGAILNEGFSEMIDFIAETRQDLQDVILYCFEGIRCSFSEDSALAEYIYSLYFGYNSSRRDCRDSIFTKFSKETIVRIFSFVVRYDYGATEHFCKTISCLSEENLNKLFDYAETLFNHDYGRKEFISDVVCSSEDALINKTFVNNHKSDSANITFAESGDYTLFVDCGHSANNFAATVYACKRNGEVYQKCATAIVTGGRTHFRAIERNYQYYFEHMSDKPIIERISYREKSKKAYEAIATDWRKLEWHTALKSAIKMA